MEIKSVIKEVAKGLSNEVDCTYAGVPIVATQGIKIKTETCKTFFKPWLPAIAIGNKKLAGMLNNQN